MSFYNSTTYLKDLDTAITNSIDISRLKGSRIFITGATGTIGSFLVDMFIRYNETDSADITIYAAGRSIQRLTERFYGANTDRLVFVEYDLMKPSKLNFVADYVIHAAGNAYPAAFSNDPVGTIVGNINGTFQMLSFAGNCDATRFLYISSGEVYGQGDTSLDSFEETYGGYLDPTSSRSCYPNSKRAAETLCSSYYKQYGLETVIVRPCHTYGPCMTKNDNRANAQFINCALRGENIILKSPGLQVRSYCYVADCASAIITVLLNGKSGEAYNSANPEVRASIAEFAETVAAAVGTKVIYACPSERDLAERTPIMKQVLNTKKLECFGWHGVYSLYEGITHTLDILRQNEKGIS